MRDSLNTEANLYDLIKFHSEILEEQKEADSFVKAFY